MNKMKKILMLCLTFIMVATTATAQDNLETNSTYTTGYIKAGKPYNFQTIDGVLFACIGNDPYTLVRYPAADERTSYVIPNYVTRIARGAFQGCKNLQELTIPSTVIYIGDNAFDDSSISSFKVEGADDTSAHTLNSSSTKASERYDLAGRSLSTSSKGVNIVRVNGNGVRKALVLQ